MFIHEKGCSKVVREKDVPSGCRTAHEKHLLGQRRMLLVTDLRRS